MCIEHYEFQEKIRSLCAYRYQVASPNSAEEFIPSSVTQRITSKHALVWNYNLLPNWKLLFALVASGTCLN